MVLSLVDLSLRTITNGIKYGTIRYPQLLPTKLRERVLNAAIKQDVADDPNGMEILTSVNFLNGMTSITAKACNDNDLIFLERLIESLATKLPDGQMVGDDVKKLNITVYEFGAPGSKFKNEKTCSDTISKVYDLIGQCPNTESLDLHIRQSHAKKIYWPLNENGYSAFNRVMENLIKLSVVGSGGHILNNERSIVNFKQLTTLKLDKCDFDNRNWYELMEKIPLVENLHLFEIFVNENANGLPFPLLRLESLEVLGNPWRFFKCDKPFVDTLMECPQLRQVHLKLDETSTDQESLVRLANMDIDLKIEIRLVVVGNDAAIFDSSSRFKLVSIFRERVTSFELYVWQQWNEQFLAGLENMLNTCKNLTSFGIRQPHFDGFTRPQINPVKQMKRVNEALVRFFGIPQRARRLEGLRLLGNFDETVLSIVFENCLNLVRLDINQCPNLRDQHFIDWVSRGGGKLTDLVVEDCNNVTSEGIIPILAKSAEGLLRYCIRRNQGKQNWKTVQLNRCPNAVGDAISP